MKKHSNAAPLQNLVPRIVIFQLCVNLGIIKKTRMKTDTNTIGLRNVHLLRELINNPQRQSLCSLNP
jgi:hypothetical protein